MNESEMTDLLRRATDDLAPDVDALVAGGVRRGRLAQRRRRAGVIASAAAAVVLIAAGSELVAGGDPWSLGPTETGPASGATATDRSAEEPDPTVDPTVGPPEPATLAVTTQQVPSTFARLAPGEVSAPTPSSGPDSAPVVDFTWNGYGIRVGLTPDDYVSGRRVTDPARRCAEASSGRPCRRRPDGSVVTTSTGTNPDVDGGTRERSAWVFRPDGWDVLVTAYNGSGKTGPPTAEQPPFTVAELRRIASSDVWFQ